MELHIYNIFFVGGAAKQHWSYYMGLSYSTSCHECNYLLPINSIPAMIRIVAWCRPGDKPLFEPMMVGLLTVTQRQPVNYDPWDI